MNEITQIASQPDYGRNSNDQSVVEICVTRVTSCIRETDSAERHCQALVALLESCLHHSLRPGAKDQDPPHAKIAADVIASVFLVRVIDNNLFQYDFYIKVNYIFRIIASGL